MLYDINSFYFLKYLKGNYGLTVEEIKKFSEECYYSGCHYVGNID